MDQPFFSMDFFFVVSFLMMPWWRGDLPWITSLSKDSNASQKTSRRLSDMKFDWKLSSRTEETHFLAVTRQVGFWSLDSTFNLLSCRLLTFIRTSRGVLWPLAASCLRPVKEGYAGMKEAHGSLLMVNSPSHGIFSSVVWLTFPLGPKAPRPQRRKEDSMLKEGE